MNGKVKTRIEIDTGLNALFWQKMNLRPVLVVRAILYEGKVKGAKSLADFLKGL